MKHQTAIHTSLIPRLHLPLSLQRQGFAMLLVIVALAVVTVATSAYLAGRMNAPDASANVGRAVKARVAAETGLNLATAILESDTVDWRTAHVNGVLLDEYDFGQGTITVTVEDLEGNPPTAETTDIILTATGQIDGLAQVAEAEITAPPSNPDIQIDLREFALFARDTIEVDNAIITPWELSPDTRNTRPLRIGTNSTASAAIELENGTRIAQANYYALDGASALLCSDDSGMLNPPTRKDLSENKPIPLPLGPTPNTSDFELIETFSPTFFHGEWPITKSIGIRGTLSINKFADVIMATPDTSLLVNGDLKLLNGGDILISANVDIVVRGDLIITNDSAIELLEGGTVNLYVNGDITVEGGVLGLTDTLVYNNDRNPPAGIDYYQNPARFKVYQLPGAAKQEWTITERSYACAIFYGLNVEMEVEDSSAVFGNIVAQRIELESGAALFYDPILDTGWGYTNLNSFVYTAEGEYDVNVTTAAVNLDDATIDDIESYVRNVSSKLEGKKGWKKIKKRTKRYGMRHHEHSRGSDDHDDDD